MWYTSCSCCRLACSTCCSRGISRVRLTALLHCERRSRLWDGKTRQKRIIFVRHAESEWNAVFNRGVWWAAILRFFRAVVQEWLMLPTTDSLFIDSPLSHQGIRQAKALYTTVNASGNSDQWLRYLSSSVPGSTIVASNLRRAIDTARIASAARLSKQGEKIRVLSSLQEIGRNIDTLAISNAYALRPRALSSVLQGEKHCDELFDLRESHGNKSLTGSGRLRLFSFAEWAVQQKEDVLIVFGHSHWLRAFCQEFFPPSFYHPARTQKIANCAVVTFELTDNVSNDGPRYQIAPQSYQSVVDGAK
ncbi:hypothetical protein PINS_up002498 [Pythium insidiosum]|nr:hypothetical protein PINS_up002498 [Pythium insidiosum]